MQQIVTPDVASFLRVHTAVDPVPCTDRVLAMMPEEDWKKPLDEFTPEELCVYLADYIASKREIHVDHRREQS